MGEAMSVYVVTERIVRREAFQWTGQPDSEMPEWARGRIRLYQPMKVHFASDTTDPRHMAPYFGIASFVDMVNWDYADMIHHGDWVFRTSGGALGVLNDARFRQIYEIAQMEIPLP